MELSNDPKTWAVGLDAVAAAQESHKVILDNEKVRVLEVIIKPKQTEPMHHHKFSSVMIVDGPAMLRYHNADGSNFEIKPSRVNGEAKVEWIPPEPLHAIENIDSKTYHAFRIELKSS